MPDRTSPLSKQKPANKTDPRTLLPEYQKHLSLRGQPIWVMEATRKYEVPQPNITKWVKRSLIQTLGHDKDDPRKLLIDECDMAYCAGVFHEFRNQGRKWLFNRDGTPYVKINEAKKKAKK